MHTNVPSALKAFFYNPGRYVCMLICIICCCIKSNAQVFYYMEVTAADTLGAYVDYYLLLNIQPDGRATARVRYVQPQTGLKQFVEQAFAERIDSIAALPRDDSKKYLLPASKPEFISGTDDGRFSQLRFTFEKKGDSTNIFYEPLAVETRQHNNWVSVTKQNIQLKSFDDLLRNKPFTEIFYPPGDVMHSYIFDFKTRGLNDSELKTKFHFVAVANTNDDKIGVPVKVGLSNMYTMVKTMAEQLGVTFQPTVISGMGFNKKDVENLIDTLKVEKGDILMFYYTGHGFRYPLDKSDYPRISMRLTPFQKIEDNNLVIEDVYNRLLPKRARFTLVMSDCCNQTIDAPIPYGLTPFKLRSTGVAGLRLNVENWKALFFPPRPSSILIGTAEKNQLAVFNPAIGGFYSHWFVAELEKSLYTNSAGTPNWWGILSAVREDTRKQSLSAVCGQNPETRCVQLAVMKVVAPR